MGFEIFTLIIDPKALEFLEKLPNDVAKRIFTKIRSTKTNPFRYFERLEGRKDFKFRMGDYRAIADIDQNKQTIHITIIGHRKNIYDRR